MPQIFLLMSTFQDLNLSSQLLTAIDELGFDTPTPIQQEAYPAVMSGKDLVGIAQTGTGKTLAYLIPIIQGLKYSKQTNPRIAILVPTRELVLQVVENIKSLTTYINLRPVGVYGGTNINAQAQLVQQGCDIIVGTPGRMYDLVVTRALSLKSIQKLVIDEVDVMLDLGFRFQLTNIFDHLPERRHNVMFSATMTEDVDELIDDFFYEPKRIAIALSGTPLDNISQQCYKVENFYTKANLLAHLLRDKAEFGKVLIFVPNKKSADRLYNVLHEDFASQLGIIHSNKTQNYRIRSIEDFDSGASRMLISTDVMARGLDLDKVSHVINFDVPKFAENYMHRIGRTGRAEHEGKSILLYTEAEQEWKDAIETLMDYKIPEMEFPEEVEISKQLTPDERPEEGDTKNPHRNRKAKIRVSGPSTHEKSAKNSKTNQGGSYHRELAKKYKKKKTRGDKNANRGKKRLR